MRPPPSNTPSTPGHQWPRSQNVQIAKIYLFLHNIIDNHCYVMKDFLFRNIRFSESPAGGAALNGIYRPSLSVGGTIPVTRVSNGCAEV